MTLLEIDERPASADAVLANIFRTMRATTGLPAEAIAWKIGVSADVIQALEAGHTRVFKSPADAVRAIEAYGRLITIDVKGIIDRLLPQISDDTSPLLRQAQTPAAAARISPTPAAVISAKLAEPARPVARDVHTSPVPRPHNGSTSPPAPASRPLPASTLPLAPAVFSEVLPAKRTRRKPPRTIRWLQRAAWCGTTLIALAAGTVMVAESHPRVATAAVQQLPPGMVQSLRSTFRRVVGVFGGRDAGLRWIEVSDPRSRKADRLP